MSTPLKFESTPIPKEPGYYLFVGYTGQLDYITRLDRMPQLWEITSEGQARTVSCFIDTPRVGVFLPLPKDQVSQAMKDAQEAVFPFMVKRARNIPYWSQERERFLDSLPEGLRERVEAELGRNG